MTGYPAPIGQVYVTFEDDKGADTILVNTCGRQISISPHIDDQSLFIAALKTLIIPDDTIQCHDPFVMLITI